MRKREKQYKRRMVIRRLCPGWIWGAYVLEEPLFSALKAEIKGRRVIK